jgi:hypothetical protein
MSVKDVSDLDVVRAAVEFHERHEDFVNQLLAARTGQALKVCDRAIQRSIRRGLVDYGVSERSCWATPSGRALLDDAGRKGAGE